MPSTARASSATPRSRPSRSPRIEEKRALIAEAAAVADQADIVKARGILTGIQRRWDEVGRISPREKERALDDELRKVETALRAREDVDWKRNNPETKARAGDMSRQLNEAIEKLERELPKAQAAGDKNAIAKAPGGPRRPQGVAEGPRHLSRRTDRAAVLHRPAPGASRGDDRRAHCLTCTRRTSTSRTQRLSAAELSAARLDGHLVELGEGYIPADAVETTHLRAASLAVLLGATLAATHLSAAWVYGAIDAAPPRHTVQRAVPRRIHHVIDRRDPVPGRIIGDDDLARGRRRAASPLPRGPRPIWRGVVETEPRRGMRSARWRRSPRGRAGGAPLVRHARARARQAGRAARARAVEDAALRRT